MRSLASVALFLLAASVCAHSGSPRFSSQGPRFSSQGSPRFSSQYEPYNLRAAVAASDQAALQHTSSLKQSTGFDALADRIGVDHDNLPLYKYVDGRGTTAESRFTVGLGGKGFQIQLAW
jgi:hypothetical protein